LPTRNQILNSINSFNILFRMEGWGFNHCDMIDTFKIMNSIYDVHSELFFHLDEGERRGHEKKLFKKRFRLDVRKYVFSNRVVDRWNQLPEKCIKCSTVNTFKKHISIELEPESYSMF